MPVSDDERQKVIGEYCILDTLPEADFDDITRIASEICHTPIALVSITDTHRYWYKSHHGLISTEAPREYAFCAHVHSSPNQVFIVPDSSKDERFVNNPMVTGAPYVSFYAGVPLINPEGYSLGTLCVLDSVPNHLNNEQIKTLKSLARQVVCLLELKRKTAQLIETQNELRGAYSDLEKFAHMASHDLKSPLNNIISLAGLLKDEYGTRFDADATEYLDYLNEAALQMSGFVMGILNYSRSSQLLVKNKENINVSALISEVKNSIKLSPGTIFHYNDEDRFIYGSKVALRQILHNLLHNAVKYNDKKDPTIHIKFNEDKYSYTFKIKDNGPGIPVQYREKIFELFKRVSDDKDPESYGIGLPLVKRLVAKLGGTLKMSSEVGFGTSFIFTIPK